jgi:DNA polymerase III delta prime subunit
VISDAYGAENLVNQLARAVAETRALPDLFKWRALPALANASTRLADGADPEIQLPAAFAKLVEHSRAVAADSRRAASLAVAASPEQ